MYAILTYEDNKQNIMLPVKLLIVGNIFFKKFDFKTYPNIYDISIYGKAFAADLKTIYQAADEKKALDALERVAEK